MCPSGAPARLALCVLLLLLLPRLQSGRSLQARPGSVRTVRDAFAEWLAAQTIRLPPKAVHAGSLSVDLFGLVCGGLSVSSLDSDYVSPTPSLHLEVSNASARCSGHWNFTDATLRHHLAGAVNASLRGVDIGSGLRLLTGGAPPLPAGLHVNSCSCAFGSIELDFGIDHMDRRARRFLERAVGKALEVLLPPVVCQEVATAVEGNVTQALRALGRRLRPWVHPAPAAEPTLGPGAVRWAESTLLSAADLLLSQALSLDQLRALVRRLTNGTGAVTLDFPHRRILNQSVPGLGSVTVDVDHVRVEGLSDLDTVAFMRPWGTHSIAQTLSWHRLALTVSGFASAYAEGSAVALRQGFSLYVVVESPSVEVAFLVGVAGPAVQRMTFEQLVQPRCLFDATTNLSLWHTNATGQLTALWLAAMEGPLGQDVVKAANDVLRLAGDAFAVTLPLIASSVAAGPVQQAVNERIAEVWPTLPAALGPCTSPAVSEEDHLATVRASGLWALVAFGCVVAVGFAGAAAWESRNAAKEEAEDEFSFVQYHSLAARTATAPLFAHPKLPWAVRFGLPALACGCLALSVAANTQRAGTVFATVTAGADTARLPDMKTFDIGGVVADMWRAGVWPLALMIAYTGGLWGYVKGLGLLVCWFVPRTVLSVRQCERVLMGLELIGKLSLANCWVLLVLQVANRYHISSESTGPETAVVDVYVEAEVGMHLFLAATFASLLVGHGMLAALRFTMRSSPGLDAAAGAEHQSCSSEAMSDTASDAPPASVAGRQLRAQVGSLLFPGLLAFLAAGLGLCVWCDVFAMRFAGAAGLMDPQPHSYSLGSVARFIPHTSSRAASSGIRFLQAAFLALVILIPLLLYAALFALWAVPLAHRTKRGVFYLAEVLNAWSGLEAFGVSLFILWFELGRFAHFIVGDKCRLVDPLIRRYLDQEVGGDDICYDSKLEFPLLGGFFVAGCGLALILTSVGILCTHSRLQGHRYRSCPTPSHSSGLVEPLPSR